jgi:hypothetical protein
MPVYHQALSTETTDIFFDLLCMLYKMIVLVNIQTVDSLKQHTELMQLGINISLIKTL